MWNNGLVADNTPVTPQFLAEGAIYALEQAGVLLRDSVTLYKAGSPASAIVLAMFGREELGRYVILRDLHRDVIRDGKIVTRAEIAAACEDHVTKQARGLLSIVERPTLDSAHGKLMLQMSNNEPQSDESRAAARELEGLQRRREKRIPQDRHQARMDCLYVGLSDGGWKRPRNTRSEEASIALLDLRNEYAVQYDRIQTGLIEFQQPEFWATLKQWPESPFLPVPVSP